MEKIEKFLTKYSNIQIAIFVAVISFLVYLPSLRNGFLYDDELMLTKNIYVTDFNVGKILSSDAMAGSGKRINYYRPLTSTSLAWEWFWWGDSPMMFHLTNNILHGLAVGILFLLLMEIGASSYLSLSSSLLFGLHPANVETVSFVASRGDSLMAIFLFWSGLNFTKYLKGEKLEHVKFKILGLFTLALLSKEFSVVGIGMYGLIWWVMKKKKTMHKTVKMISGGVGMILGYFGYRRFFVYGESSYDIASFDGVYENSLVARLMTMPRILFEYLKILIWPHPLYMERKVQLFETLNLWIVLLVLLVYLVFRLGKWEYLNKKTRWTWFGGLWFVGMMAPVLGILPMNNMLYEHWLYLAMVGFFVVLIRTIGIMFGEKTSLALVGILLVGFSVKTINQQKYWTDAISSYEHMLKLTGNPRFLTNLCLEYGRLEEYEKALDYCNKALDHEYKFPDTYYFMGGVYYKLGQVDLAEEYYLEALKVAEQYYLARKQLYFIYMSQNRFEEAFGMAKILVSQSPDAAEYRTMLLDAKLKMEKSNENK